MVEAQACNPYALHEALFNLYAMQPFSNTTSISKLLSFHFMQI